MVHNKQYLSSLEVDIVKVHESSSRADIIRVRINNIYMRESELLQIISKLIRNPVKHNENIITT